MEALGVGAPAPVGKPEDEQARGRKVWVDKSKDGRFIDLFEQTRSIQGQPVTKVTRFNNVNATGTRPQVAGYFLMDARGQTLCEARVTKVQYDAASGATVPHVI